jgi:hypothetical protein
MPNFLLAIGQSSLLKYSQSSNFTTIHSVNCLGRQLTSQLILPSEGDESSYVLQPK